MRTINSSIKLLLVYLSFGFSCNKWVKMAEQQKIKLTPEPVLIVDNKISFEINLELPITHLSNVDSIIYYIGLTENKEDYIDKTSLSKSDIRLESQSVIIRTKNINAEISTDLVEDAIFIWYDVLRNNKIVTSSSKILIGRILAEN